MRLRLDMCDVDFQLKIKDWSKPKSGNFEDDRWSVVEFCLKGKYIEYSLDSEIMLCSEVMDLCDALGALLDNKISEDCKVRFVEPDFEFYLYTAKRLYDIPGEVLYRDGFEDVDICMQMIVRFWFHGILGSNYFTMAFERNEIEALYTYLCMVTGKIKKDDKKIKKMLKDGLILPE